MFLAKYTDNPPQFHTGVWQYMFARNIDQEFMEQLILIRRASKSRNISH